MGRSRIRAAGAIDPAPRRQRSRRAGPSRAASAEGGGTTSAVAGAAEGQDPAAVEPDAGDWDERVLELVRRLPGRFFVVLDEAYTIRWVSHHAGRVLGTTTAALQGRPAHEIVHPDDLDVALAELGRLSEEAVTDLVTMEADLDQTAKMRLVTEGGVSVNIEFKAFNLFSDPDVRALGLLGRVLTTQAHLDAVMDRLGTATPLADMLALLADHLGAAVASGEHRIVRFVDGLTVAPGGRRPGADPLLPPAVLHAASLAGAGTTVLDDVDTFPTTTREAVARRGLTTCFVHRITAHGRDEAVGAVVSWRPTATLSLGVRDCLATTARLAGIAMSVHGTAEELRSAALVDSLTGCGNRRQLDTWVADVRGHVAVLVVDLDHFKLINDRHGHAAGDIVLAEVARRLMSSSRSVALVARSGGDEFAVLIPGVRHVAQAAAAADRFTATMAAPISIGSERLQVTASVGIALNAPDQTMSETFAVADTSLYAAKARRQAHGLTNR